MEQNIAFNFLGKIAAVVRGTPAGRGLIFYCRPANVFFHARPARRFREPERRYRVESADDTLHSSCRSSYFRSRRRRRRRPRGKILSFATGQDGKSRGGKDTLILSFLHFPLGQSLQRFSVESRLSSMEVIKTKTYSWTCERGV